MHVMIDLETLGTSVDAAITQFGMAVFNLPGPRLIPEYKGFQWNFDPTHQGRRIDWSTIKWWMGQSDEARLAFIKETKDELQTFLPVLRGLFDWDKVEGVWSHGATFDISIMTHAFEQQGLKTPWRHRAIRDTRTIFWLAGYEEEKSMPKKNSRIASEDAIAQAIAVQDAYMKLRGDAP